MQHWFMELKYYAPGTFKHMLVYGISIGKAQKIAIRYLNTPADF